MDTTVDSFIATCKMRLARLSPSHSIRARSDSLLNALDLTKLSMYMENSFKFSGKTSCPGGCDPEKILRYPLNISTVFSVMLARMSLRLLSSVLEAAASGN